MEWTTTAMADRIVVNSHFTAGVVRQTFPRIQSFSTMRVLYPVPSDLSPYGPEMPLPECVHLQESVYSGSTATKVEHLFVSINRYERKKDVDRAIKALAELKRQVSTKLFVGVRLVIAGGYDTRLTENVEYFAELVKLANELKVDSHVIFFRNISADEKVNYFLKIKLITPQCQLTFRYGY